jgi:serine/threonine-protein kinase
MVGRLEELRRALGGSYDLERELGRGGMATVYLGFDRRHDRRVAIKVLEPDLAGSLGADRFLREIRIASQLSHPNILPVFDSGEVERQLYYVMPLVEGQSLRERLTKDGALPVAEALRIGIEVADALAYSHGRGVIHRDIKPENVMFVGGHAIVADFGIARAIDQAGGDKLTSTGLAIGTPSYMSPEQWTGMEKLDGRSDIYSLGCMLFEMLVGEPPFTGPTPQVILARHSLEAMPSIRIARPTVAPAIEEAIRKAMEKNPADRFATAESFAEALRAAQHAPTSSAPFRSPVAWWRQPRRLAAIAGGILVLSLAAFAGWRLRGGTGSADRMRLVVLPFRNLGLPDDEYFSEGLTEEITGRLSSIANLGVIARTSAIQYKNTTKSVQEIARDLNVGYLIEGSVRRDRAARSGQQVRITARLIKAADGNSLWGNDYTFELADVFAVQASVAEKVIEALELSLLEPERRRITAKPTANVEAYDLYLRGNSYYNRSWERSDVDSARMMYEQAAQRDPRFALAFAQLGKTEAWIHRLGYDATERRLTMARQAIDRALALDSDLPEAHIALGLYYYWGKWDYEQAIDHLSTARRSQPANAWVHLQMGNIRRRKGEWDEAAASYQRAGELDPRYHIIWFNLGILYEHIHKYADAERYLDRTLALNPTFLDAYLRKAAVLVSRDGDLAGARRVMDTAAARIPPERWRPLGASWLLGFSRTLYPDPALRRRLVVLGSYGLDTASYYLEKSELEPDGPAARALLDSARAVLARRQAATPDQPLIAATQGVVFARLGMPNEAVAAATRATTLTSVAHDALDGPDWAQNLARVQVLVGNRDAALDIVELLLKIPSRLTAQWLRLDPEWAPLRADGRLDRLLRTSPATPVTSP